MEDEDWRGERAIERGGGVREAYEDWERDVLPVAPWATTRKSTNRSYLLGLRAGIRTNMVFCPFD
jgi:hypothetical protein